MFLELKIFRNRQHHLNFLISAFIILSMCKITKHKDFPTKHFSGSMLLPKKIRAVLSTQVADNILKRCGTVQTFIIILTYFSVDEEMRSNNQTI